MSGLLWTPMQYIVTWKVKCGFSTMSNEINSSRFEMHNAYSIHNFANIPSFIHQKLQHDSDPSPSLQNIPSPILPPL